jgi:phytoene desaturase
MSSQPKGLVLGGGIGGLVTAILLSARGFDITLLEQNESLGGKLQRVQLGSYTFDFGPSTLTMPWIFEKVFELAGEPVDPMLDFVKLDINSRNFFPDGTRIDLSADTDRMEEQLADCSKEDRQGFASYIQEVTRLYNVAQEQFFTRSFARWQDYVSPTLGKALLSVHPFTGMDAFHRRYFRDPRLLAMMNRYATYVGSSPSATPATLSMIAYLELVKGVYYARGGNYTIVEALERLARKVGVRIYTGIRAEGIVCRDGQAVGVLACGERWEADLVVSNIDVNTTARLLEPPGSEPKNVTLSSSGFLGLFGIKKRLPVLHHHNVFYPADYGSEFTDMFEHGRWPQSPALYVCCSSVTEPNRGGEEGSNLYALVNVPALAKDTSSPQSRLSEAEVKSYRDQVLGALSARLGYEELETLVETESLYTPQYIADRTGAYAGALYGAASHGWPSTFFRPTLVSRKVKSLYLVGGTTHPGGGTPMVTISGILAAEFISSRHKSKTRPAR